MVGLAEKISATAYKIVIIVLVLVLIGFAAFSSGSFGLGDKAKAEQSVAGLYRLITGGDVEVLKTVEQSGVYKVTVRFNDVTGRDTLQDIYVTKDGIFFTDRLVNLEAQRAVLTNQSAFAQCLFDKNVRIFGLANDPATQAQLQALGAFSVRIYVDCAGANLAVCQQLNITQVPVIFSNNQLVQGPQNTQWFVQNTGCSL